MGFLDKINMVLFGKPPRSAQGLNRNDPCWCGSGKKYKRCHEEKDRKYYASRGSSCRPTS